MKKNIMIIGIILMLTSASIFAQENDGYNSNSYDNNTPDNFYLEMNYNLPFESTIGVYETVSFGLGYRFWGIFVVKGEMFTEVEFGGDNFLNINKITPIGLFSIGFGMCIDFGNISMIWDWAPIYKRTSYGLETYSSSSKFGITIDLTKTLKFEIYKRDLYDFYSLDISTDKVNIFGIGIIWYLL